MNTQVCRECNQEKTRALLKLAASNAVDRKHRKIWIDASGRQWNGHQCPDCKYAPKPSPVTFKAVSVTLSHRRCKACGVQLATDRYFRCTSCVRQAPDVKAEDTSWLNGALV